MRKTPGHGVKLSYYEFGATSFFASRFDQRFSYCLYVPEGYQETGTRRLPLVVLIHGTERGAQRYRDEFVDFAERHQCLILAPLFPCGIIEPGELDNYKFIRFHDIRFDHVVLEMVDEIAERYRLASDRFMIHGFSGGGHFVHRFLYLHPRRLAAVSIGAPGMVTLLDPGRQWWVGTGDLNRVFGTGVDLDAMKNVAIQMIVGTEDTGTWEITVQETSPRWMPGVNECGATRIDRLKALRESFVAHGIDVRFDLVPGVAHEGYHPALLASVKGFFSDALEREQAA
jgi:predicted peptidase